jgi:pimeloyl-ACP methyl ester carboxylesterase
MRGTDRLNGQRALKVTWIGMRITGRFSRRIGGWFAARLWFTPWKAPLSERAVAREAAWLEGTEQLRIPFQGGELTGFVAGVGPTVVLVHGWGERASTMGAFVAPLVDAGYRVAAIDLPGHGGSKGTETHLLAQAEAIAATANGLGGVDTVIAHSMGAMGAMLAIEQGLRPRRVALLAPAVRAAHALGKFKVLFALRDRAADGLRAHIERHFGADIWERLSSDRIAQGLDIPALIVHDDEDPQIDAADGALLARAWNGARFVSTQGLGHVKVVRDAETIDRVVDFIAERTLRLGRSPVSISVG